MKIAIDFDGTIVEDRYPKIGKPMPFAFETMAGLQDRGHKLILWTARSDESLDKAVEFCLANGLEFYAVNESYPGERLKERESRKVLADLFIDDRNLGGFPGWSQVWSTLTAEEEAHSEAEFEFSREKSWIERLFSK
ncbi:hypothetical protein FUAX_21630 [Fulvitalea axinellae]|uniref:Hydrolase n=1 Tax=Fulvitalea axinellae TaxID=1182444 RepID=A0AAU9D9Z7_9BACT|nr:hypothetical protein FUAX_21630 [Fulvitalea axinellae]